MYKHLCSIDSDFFLPSAPLQLEKSQASKVFHNRVKSDQVEPPFSTFYVLDQKWPKMVTCLNQNLN